MKIGITCYPTYGGSGVVATEMGKELAAKFGVGEGLDSIVLIEDEQAFMRSTATLRVARGLGGAWWLAYTLIVVPVSIRDWFYKLFACHRLRVLRVHEFFNKSRKECEWIQISCEELKTAWKPDVTRRNAKR